MGVTAEDNRLFVETVWYRYRNRIGIRWRNLPEYFGDYRVIYSRWSQTGVRERVFLAEEADNEYAMIDAYGLCPPTSC